MDYEKYKNALEKAKIRYNEIKDTNCSEKEFLLELFPELKESKDRIRKGLIKALSSVGKRNWGGIDVFESIAWLEKQGKKKTTNKVEPKFKVDDWIANDYCTGKVIALTDDAYLLDSGQGIPFSCEHNVHLWTIADAEADSNIDVLLNALTTVSEYVNELKHGLKHEKEDLSKLP